MNLFLGQPLSNPAWKSGGVKDIYYFGRPDDHAREQTPRESNFRQFFVYCQHCRSYQITAVAAYNEESGETELILRCCRCQRFEKIHLK